MTSPIITLQTDHVASSSLESSAFYTEALIYGIYLVLLLQSLWKHLRNASCRKSSRRWAMSGMAAVMFCVATVHAAISLRQLYSTSDASQKAEVHTNLHGALCGYAKLVLEVVNCFLGDFVMISITFTIESQTDRARYHSICSPQMQYTALLSLLLLSLASGIGMVCTSAHGDVLSSAIKPSLRNFLITWASLLLATNLFSTAVFVYKYRSRQCDTPYFVVLHVLTRCPSYATPERWNAKVPDGPLDVLLLTLTWSSILYCLTFSVLLALFLSGSSAFFILNHTITQLVGVYPILAVIFVVDDKDIASSPPSRWPERWFAPRLDCISGFYHGSTMSLTSLPAKETPEFRDPFPPTGQRVLPDNKPTIEAAEVPVYPPTIMSGLREKLSHPFPPSSFSVERKASSASDASLTPSVLISVEVETRVDRDDILPTV